MLPGRPRKGHRQQKTKNMVRGRYLATFSSNPFAISEKLVAALVAAGVLVATFGLTSNWQTRRSTFTTCCYVATTRVNSGEKQRTGKPKENMLATVWRGWTLIRTLRQPWASSFWPLAKTQAKGGNPKIYELLLPCYNPYKQRGKTADRKTKRKSGSPQIDADERWFGPCNLEWGWIQDINSGFSVSHLLSHVFNELQDHMQDRYGTRQGWVQHFRCLYPVKDILCRSQKRGQMPKRRNRNPG